VGGPYNDSILLHLLDAKRRLPMSTGEYHSEAANLTCAGQPEQIGSFLDRHPGSGMPFGFPPLSEEEYATMATWLQEGARGPSPQQQRDLTAPSPAATAEITKWEDFLNRDDPKHALTARYLYEHFFLAHLNFRAAGPHEFYEIVRSTTPPGEPVDVIATRRPYDAPGVDPVFYRFRKIHTTIVYKTHMVVELDDAALERIRRQFIATPWLEPLQPAALGDETGANPFLIYAQIPPRVRYQFLLDHAEYMIRTFIRGPVCKGQVALNVIHDHFWVMFLDPAADKTVGRPEFLLEQAGNLRLPTEQGSNERILLTFSNRYRDRYKTFYHAKSALYDETDPEGLGLEAIWKGERPSDAPLLTVYRHFDSASVHKGVLGGLPRTLWVIDYSQFERIYYALVAGFDVFGNVSHQVNVRRYMDYLRMEGELNFVEFLPRDLRVQTLQSWYLGDRAFEDVDHELSKRGTKIRYTTSDPKRELVEKVVEGHILESTGIGFDDINYRRAGETVEMPSSFETHEDIMNGFRALTAPGTGFIRHVNSSEANVLYVRVRNYEGRDHFFSIVINRWHDNVNSLFGEAKRLDPTKDTIDFQEGSIGSYPNYFLDLEGKDVPELFDVLENFDDSEAYQARFDRFGINRSDPRFWEVYDWFQKQLFAARPLEAGLYDLNRYYSVAEVE
jgi:hypothetical protein